MGDKLLSILGIARKAGKLTYGFDASIKSVLEGKTQLILTADNASPRTLLNIKRVCDENNIELIQLKCTAEQLGAGIGRSSVAAVAIHGESFTKKVKETFKQSGGII